MKPAESFEFHTQEQEVLFGCGTLNRAAEVVDRLGGKRVLLVCTERARASPEGKRLQDLLADRLVGSFTGIRTHVVLDTVEAVFQSAKEAKADFVVSFGGGSALGTGKALGLWWIREAEARKKTFGRAPHLCIPTTYSGTEMTIIAGQRDEKLGRKRPGRDPRILPLAVIYDPEATMSLPPRVTASSAMNALAHCAEGLYATVADPVGLAAAKDAAALIGRNLLRCVRDGRDLGARTQMLKAGFLAGFTVHHTGIGLHHGICHVLGGRYGLEHGIANSIILPHALRYNLDATASQQAELARAMGVAGVGEKDEEAGGRGIDFIAKLREESALPGRLLEAGVPESDIPSLAEEAMESRAVKANPKPISEPAQVEEVLRAAF
ncbi:MAG: iron-containing alcohol dehydrogenase family protein [Nitrospinota bacterium]